MCANIKIKENPDFTQLRESIVNHLYSIADESKSNNDFDYSYAFENIATMVRFYAGVSDSENLMVKLISIRDHNLSFNFSDRVKEGWIDAILQVEAFISSLKK